MKATMLVNRSLLRSDRICGFCYNSGMHTVRLLLNDNEWRADLSITEEGFRATRPLGAHPVTGPKIWVFGCSITFGWPLSDADTVTWHLQNMLPTCDVRNYAVNGFGTHQNAVLLKHKLANERPDVVVFMYQAGHVWRNVAQPSWVCGQRSTQLKLGVEEGLGDAEYMRAGYCFSETGHSIYIKKFSLSDPIFSISECQNDLFNPDVFYAYLVTIGLYDHVIELSEQNNFKFIVGMLTPKLDDTLTAHVRRKGITVCPVAVPDTPEYRCDPFDDHPNAKAHRMYAEALLPAITTSL